MSRLLQDFRYGLRQLVHSPGFTAVAVITLALGIGANTSVFSAVNALFLHPPGISHPERVVVLRVRYGKLGLKSIAVSAYDFSLIRDSKEVFESAALETTSDFNYTSETWPQRLRGAQVSWQWFQVFGARPILGRVFTPEEDQPNNNHEVVLSYAAWHRWFGSDPNLIGKSIPLNGERYQVIGVMGPEFQAPTPEPALWVPLGLEPAEFQLTNAFNESYFAAARLKPDVSFAQASSRVAILAGQVINNPISTFPKDSQWGMFLMPVTDFAFGALRDPLLILSGAVAFVLLIACANVAGLLLSRAAARSKELAVRATLGASRSRLIVQTLNENLLLGAIAIAAGIVVAQVVTRALPLVAPADLISGFTFPLDRHVLLFTISIGIAAVLIFGCAPALYLASIDPFNTLRESGRWSTGNRARKLFRSLLVTAELALGVVLLAGTGLLLKSLNRIGRVDPGFQPRGVITAAISLPDKQYDTPEKQIAFFRHVLESISQTPGVESAGEGMEVPFAGTNNSASFEIEGRPTNPGDPGPHGDSRYVTPGYFRALGIPLIKGRYFTDDDRIGSQAVVVIDENLAREYWSNEDPIGKHMRRYGKDWATIVGVAGHIRFTQLVGEESSSATSQSSSKGAYYFPTFQAGAPGGFLVLKTRGNPEPLVETIRRAVREVDANQPVSDIKTMDQRIAESFGPQRFAANLLAIFAGLAVLLAAVGLYGLISYSVTQRTNEFGVRIALGANRSQLLGMVIRQGAMLALIGIGLGTVLGIVLMRALQSMLYGVSAADPLSFLAAGLLLVVVALLACYMPAHRAAQVDPLVALRYE
jgi:predicted permease